MKQPILRYLMIALIVTSVQLTFSQRTIRMNIERIVSDAAIIVHGTIVSAESAIDPKTKILSTFVTIDVKENLFGADQQQIILKMLGGSTKDRTMKLADMPHYTAGQEIIGMFFAPSKSGFTSPVGMGQGTFTVQTNSRTGARVIRTMADHRQLFSGMKHPSALARAEWLTQADPQIDAAEFTQTIRSLISTLKK